MKTINKTVKTLQRDEIENIIKEYNIDRNRFYEYNKLKYENILDNFKKSFLKAEEHSLKELKYCWLNFGEDIIVEKKINEEVGKWLEFLKEAKAGIPKTDTKCYFITDECMVYEGFINEIFAVLSEITALTEDFYIVSRKFDWVLAYVSEGYAAVLLKKGV